MKGSPVKALVTDIDMPGRINGWALAWEVHSLLLPKKLVALNHAPILCLRDVLCSDSTRLRLKLA